MDAERNPLALRFGRNLRACRNRAGLSQEALCSLASLDRSEIGLLERGENAPLLDTIVKLASALSVPLEELLGGIGWICPVYCDYFPGEFEFADPVDAPVE